jgi:copper resistance protein C
MNALKVCLAVALSVVAAGNAAAHSFPESEIPAAGATLNASPGRVAIKFDAPIEHLFARLQVVDHEGKELVLGAPEVDAEGVTLSVKLPVLKPGQYTVEWAVVCVDTHHTYGSYQFIVGGAGS